MERAPKALCGFAGRNDLWLKREDVHELGVFKWRSTLPVVRSLVAQSHKAVVTSSTGNHGAAVAWACTQLGAKAIVFVPPAASARKLALLESLGADVRVVGGDLDEAKDAARAYANAEGLRFFEDGAEPLQYEAYEAIGEEIVDQLPLPPQRWSRRSVTGHSREESGPRSEGLAPRPFGLESSPKKCR